MDHVAPEKPSPAGMPSPSEMSDSPDLPVAAGPRVALLGLGTVGTAVAARLLDPAWAAMLGTRQQAVPRLVGIADLDLERDRGLDIPEEVRQVTDYSLLLDDGVDVVVELIGGAEVAAEAVLAAIAAGKPVVTANKHLMATRGRELEEAARAAGVALRFEAAVLAGVPVLGPLVRELGANRLDGFRGLFNGTTNYILTTMAADARDYADVLHEARARGFAEADPSSDVVGLDAAYKLALLARLAWGGWIDVDAVRRTVPGRDAQSGAGIDGVRRSHLSVAARLGMTLKLVARARHIEPGLCGAVTLMAVSTASTLGSTAGVTNVVEFMADPAGRVAFAGPGAGGPATSGAILADVLAVARGEGSTWGPLPPAVEFAIEDDLAGERGWLVVLDGVGQAGLPDAVRELALAVTDEGFVCRPISLVTLSARLGASAPVMTAYPVLEEA